MTPRKFHFILIYCFSQFCVAITKYLRLGALYSKEVFGVKISVAWRATQQSRPGGGLRHSGAMEVGGVVRGIWQDCSTSNMANSVAGA